MVKGVLDPFQMVAIMWVGNGRILEITLILSKIVFYGKLDQHNSRSAFGFIKRQSWTISIWANCECSLSYLWHVYSEKSESSTVTCVNDILK